jgi:hypothetical protein
VSAAKREPRKITVAEIANRFDVDGASYWWGDRWKPAVHRRDGGGYGIRFVKTHTVYNTGSTTTFDYFELDDDGLITTAPRGFARDYKPGRVVDIAEAAERYAVPDPDATRIGLPR